MSKRKVSVEDKLYAVNLYLDGKASQRRIAAMFDVGLSSVQQWIRNYESMGADAFTLKGNKKYSKELKQQAVSDYLAGRGSLNDICKKYKIRAISKLESWIKKYNSHEELKSSGTGGNIIMTKGRKTTFEERVEIVQYCIAHDRNYAETAIKYQVSYQQARSYTIKYESGGVEALKDNRGKRKYPDKMNELEKLRAEVKILKAEKERAEMEASFLKKLEEIERRRG
jgi:transposase-like protein